jgi:hypothetical protein
VDDFPRLILITAEDRSSKEIDCERGTDQYTENQEERNAKYHILPAYINISENPVHVYLLFSCRYQGRSPASLIDLSERASACLDSEWLDRLVTSTP